MMGEAPSPCDSGDVVQTRHRLQGPQSRQVGSVVVAVSHQHQRATGGLRRMRIMDRVANHQRPLRVGVHSLASFEQRHRVGLFARAGALARHLLKEMVQTLFAQQLPGKFGRLVGDAGQ